MTRLSVPFSAKLFVLVLLGSLLPGFADAQRLANATPSGTIAGTLAGEQAEWRTYEIPVGDSVQNTASYLRIMGADGPHSYTVQGHRGSSYTQHSLSITFGTIFGPLADCPCTVEGEVMYLPTSSMFSDIYLAEGATIQVDEVVDLGDGSYSMKGSVQATLLFYPSPSAQPDEGNTRDVDVTFDIDHMSEEILDL